MDNVVAVVLGGGQGSRLYPLTKYRSKPAVPIAGKYRLIDIPLSNCINSDLKKIYVVTQFNSASLHQHMNAYSFSQFSSGFVEILAAQQTAENPDWYQGTADAVRQNLTFLKGRGIDYVLILSGDQLYHMDYRKMMETHRKSGADVTISAVPVTRKDASELGIMRLDEGGRVQGFLEKPQSDEETEDFCVTPEWIQGQGIEPKGRECIASMGIYLFNRDFLVDILDKTDYKDFGREVFPTSIRTRHVQCHLFDGYWEDIGTIKSFYDANLQLTAIRPDFQLSLPDDPIYTRARFLPSSRIDGATISRSLIADGCEIRSGAVIENCVIGLRCTIGENAVIRNSIIMGNDYYETDQEIADAHAKGIPPLGIGSGAIIDGAIVDKNCRIGRDVKIVNSKKVDKTDELHFGMIRDGVVVISKKTQLDDHWTLDNSLE
jgi:glucose-1-phosphate adenylyltransferase